MYLDDRREIAGRLERVDCKIGARVNSRRAGEDTELALDFAPSELIVKGEAFRKQQRDLEALARHRFDREPHQRRRDSFVPIFLERKHRADTAHWHRLSVEID